MFRTHPTFQDIIVNIDTVMAYFAQKLEQKGGNPSPSEVLEVIQQGSLQFRRDRLKVTHQLGLYQIVPFNPPPQGHYRLHFQKLGMPQSMFSLACSSFHYLLKLHKQVGFVNRHDTH